MRESILHYFWKTKKIGPFNLTGTKGEQIQILNYGYHNHQSGPDFLEASIQIDKKIWYGHVEMHNNSSDWNKHKHHDDEKYKNVILHVVFNDDAQIKTYQGQPICCLELQKFISKRSIKQMGEILNSSKAIPCENHLAEVEPIRWFDLKDKLSVERLEERFIKIEKIHQQKRSDFEQTCFTWLTQYFGSSSNKKALEMLGHSLHWKHLYQSYGNVLQCEALILGQAGFLEKNKNQNNYYNQLWNQYAFLKKKHKLSPTKVQWNYMRIRPSGFPEFRLAQLATIYANNGLMFDRIKSADSLKEINQIFRFSPSIYWEDHYYFDKEGKKRNTIIGDQFLKKIIINAVIPIRYFYGKKTGNNKMQSSAIAILEQLPAEKNKITRLWSNLGIQAENAFDSQSLIQLKQKHCDKKKCFNCAVGHAILSKNEVFEEVEP